MILIIFLYMILALSFIVAKYVLLYAQPFFLIAVRMLIAGSFLLGHQWFFGDKNSFYSCLNQKKDFLLVSIFHIYCAFAFEFWALQYISALKTVLIYSATPFITAVLAYYLLNEKLSSRKIAGMSVATIGFIPLFTLTAQESPLSLVIPDYLYLYKNSYVTLPDIILLLAVLSGSYGWFHVKKLINKNHSFVFVNGSAMFIGGFLCLITSLCYEGLSGELVSSWPLFLSWLSLLIFLSNVVFYNLYGYLIKNYSMTFISLCGFLCPLFSALFEWGLLGGTILWQHLFCFTMVTIGLLIFHRQALGQE